MTSVKRILIASDRSNSGKTLIASGIMRALSKKMKVRGFKAGPDFIDPGYHKIATGYPSINLDLWMMGEENVKKSLSKYMKGFDVGVIEGVMGLYDGIETSFSTYELAKVTKTPIILVINCSNISSTVGAIVKGLKLYRKDVYVKGVIFNKIGSQTHYNYCKRAIEDDVEVLGYIPYDKSLEVKSRHLGLLTIEDNKEVSEIIGRIGEMVQQYIDLDKMLEIIDDEELNFGVADRDSRNTEPKQKLAIAYDSAFSFYYAENLDILKKKYELEFFSPLNNETVSDVDAVYIGGGYPELHLRELENSSNTKAWLKRLSYDGIKIYAECGGLMYLSNNLIDENDNKYKMVGVFDIDIKTKDKLTIGYTELESISDNFLVPKDTIVRGHEFHVSKPLSVNERTFTFKVKIGRGLFNGFDGVRIHNTIASYSHLHFSNFQREIVF